MMLGSIVNAVTGLATSYLDGKTAVQKSKAEIAIKRAASESDWEHAAISASDGSYKDEAWTLVFILILGANFLPAAQPYMEQGFKNLSQAPAWFTWAMYASIAASFGIRSIKGLSGMKK